MAPDGKPGKGIFLVHGLGDSPWSFSDIGPALAGGPVWYSDWGYAEEGKNHARLTFNPYFAWQAEVMRQVLTND